MIVHLPEAAGRALPAPAGAKRSASPGDAPEGLRARTLSGLKWTYLGALTSGVLQVGVTATLSRLLAPADYGLMAAAGLFLRFGSYFSEMGVGQALVQKPAISPEDIRAAFASSSALGVLAGAAVAAAAPWARLILDTPQVVPVVRLVALSLALNGLACASLALLRRGLRFGILAGIEVASYFAAYAFLGIPLALAGCGVWALTAALLAQPALTLVLAYAAARHPLRPCPRWRPCRGLLAYGSQLSLTGFAEYLFFFAEPSAVGRVWGGATLGVYNRATLVANLPGSQLSAALMKVLFPAFSRVQADAPRMAAGYLQGLTAMNLVTIPVACGMVPAARDLVLTVLGEQYAAAAPLIQVLGWALPVGMAASVAATITNARAEICSRLLQQVGLCAVMWAVVFGAAEHGVRAVALASVAVQAVRLMAFQRLALRSLALPARVLPATVVPGLWAGLLASAAVVAAAMALPQAAPAARLAVEIGAGALAWTGFCLARLPRQLAPVVLFALDASGAAMRMPALARYRLRLASSLRAGVTC